MLLVAGCGSTTHRHATQPRPTGARSLLQLFKQSPQGHGSSASTPEMPPLVRARVKRYQETHGKFGCVRASYSYAAHQWTVGACTPN